MIGFWDEYRFLSNFFPSKVTYDGEEYSSVEHAYQAAKTLDKETRKLIQQTVKPGDVKRMGYKVKLRDDWEQIKVSVMKQLLEQKFAPGTSFRQKLKDTGSQELVEWNGWHDKIWGKCTCDKCKGQGQNILGSLLMDIRDRKEDDV